MLGELTAEIDRLNAALNDLRDEYGLFVARNEERMNEHLFAQRVREFERRIADLEERLHAAEEEYAEVVDREADELGAMQSPDPAPFEEEFEELAETEAYGHPVEDVLDDTATEEQLREADRQAQFDQYGE